MLNTYEDAFQFDPQTHGEDMDLYESDGLHLLEKAQEALLNFYDEDSADRLIAMANAYATLSVSNRLDILTKAIESK